MNNYIILKGCHYSNFFPSLCLVEPRKKFEKTFIFDKSCKYEIKEECCVNKLFGFCFGLFGVHRTSVRFGWTYCKEMNEIFIWKYVYKNSKLDKQKIAAVEIGSKHGYSIEMYRAIKAINKAYYDVVFKMDGNVIAKDSVKDKHSLLLTLGPYFGGHTRAPHKMILKYT